MTRRHLAVVFRHGDRSPVFNAQDPLPFESTVEAAAWTLSLPTRQFCETLESRFPVKSLYGQTRDEANLGSTFGSLTSLGVLQMRKLGQILLELAPEVQPRRVWSSNFRRTQFSAQCVLAGLCPSSSSPHPSIEVGTNVLNVWGTNPTLKRLLKSNGQLGTDIANSVTPEEALAKQVIMKHVPAFGYQIRPFSWMSALDFTMCREGKQEGGGILRGRPNPVRQFELFQLMLEHETDHPLSQEESISFSAFGAALNKTFSCTFTDAKLLFQEIDRDGNGRVDFKEMKQFFDRIRLPGSPMPSELVEASRVVEQAVCRRFDTILAQPAIRRISCGSVLKTLLEGMDDALKEPSSYPTMDLYSAHDVTLIPLIKHLGIWDASRRWPGVSSALVFDLVGNTVSVRYWDGVRDGKSGLEPHAGMALKRVKLFNGEEEVDLDSCRTWVAKL